MILRLLCIWLVFYSLLSSLMHGTMNLKHLHLFTLYMSSWRGQENFIVRVTNVIHFCSQRLHTPWTSDWMHTRQDRRIRTVLVFTLTKNATKPNPFEIISLQTTRKKNTWKTEETLARAVVTLETERIKGTNPWCLWWLWYLCSWRHKPEDSNLHQHRCENIKCLTTVITRPMDQCRRRAKTQIYTWCLETTNCTKIRNRVRTKSYT
jgi:hypothetical protein